MPAGPAVAVAVTFVWLGMVLAISFIEAPLKFQAPGVTVRIGLGIGRLVFRTLNAVEAGFAVALVVLAFVHDAPAAAVMAGAVAVALLLAQLLLVRPALNRRSDAILAGDDDVPRSRGHLAYVALEVLKTAALVVTGVALLAS
ncbi:MAG: hypothetical protein ABS81_16080 [Pseudonocardia sp. SCN 72-86]|nr:MAG: hypothetical protein ABS81_16080 [Pseudonocardia sp. SCN 72-86]